jgi:glutamyl-tRNA synthetase
LVSLLGKGAPASEGLTAEGAQALLTEAAAAAGVKKGVLMKSLRAALLGSLQGPDLISSWRLLHALGEDRPRLERAIQSSMP